MQTLQFNEIEEQSGSITIRKTMILEQYKNDYSIELHTAVKHENDHFFNTVHIAAGYGDTPKQAYKMAYSRLGNHKSIWE